MRLALIAAAAIGFSQTGMAQTDERPGSTPALGEAAPPAPESDRSASSADQPFAGFDPSTLPSFLGQVLSQSPRRAAAPGTVVPQGATGAPVYSPRAARRDAFRSRLYAKRMALIERIRVAAEQSGDEQRAAQAEQLGAVVTKVHTEGLGSIVQMLGQLQAARQSPETSSSSPPPEVPDVDFGAAAPLPTDDAPRSEPESSTAPPEPQPDGGPDLPPSLPLP